MEPLHEFIEDMAGRTGWYVLSYIPPSEERVPIITNGWGSNNEYAELRFEGNFLLLVTKDTRRW